jgi:hypothetical protein
MRKTWLILVISFVVPFLIGGIGAWLWTENTSDRPHGALASDKEIADAERQIDIESNNKFLIFGSGAGLVGLLLAGGVLFVFRR